MSKKRTKQYLMLLLVIGLVSIASGGSGTFASFSAETTNAGNYFATGTLILNDNGGTQTCTSAANTGNLNTNGQDCDTLFDITNTSVADPHGYLNASTLTGAASLVLAAPGLQGAAIDKGDQITIHDSTNGDETVTAGARVDIGATTIPLDALTPTTIDHGASTFVTDNSGVYYAQLTLTNAGSIDAKGISVKKGNAGSCSTTYQEPSGTLTAGLTSPSSVSTLALQLGTGTGSPLVSSGNATYHAGQPIVVKQGLHAQTFIVASDTVIPSSGTVSVPVTSDNANFSYTTVGATVQGPQFTGTQHDLCSVLNFGIIETDNTFSDTGALGCAFGGSTVASLGCDLGSVTGLSALTTSFTALNLADGASGNTAGELDHSQSRYFLLALKVPDYSAFDNADQNRATTSFDLTWHIDQV